MSLMPTVSEVFFFKRGQNKHSTPKRNFNVISIRTQGEAVFVQGNRKIYVDTGHLLFIPRETEYYQYTDGEEGIAIHIDGHIPCEEITLFSLGNEDIALFFDIVQLWKNSTDTDRYMAHSKLYALMANILSGQNKKTDVITKGYEKLNSMYKNPSLKISDISNDLYISSVYFRREFKKKYGVTPKQYLSSLRLNYAELLLKNKYCNVNEAAFQSGFSDPNYFSAVFKKRFGVSPLNYVKNTHT